MASDARSLAQWLFGLGRRDKPEPDVEAGGLILTPELEPLSGSRGAACCLAALLFGGEAAAAEAELDV